MSSWRDANGPSWARPAPPHRPDAVCSVWAVLGRLLWLSSAPSFLRLAEKSGRRAPSRDRKSTRLNSSQLHVVHPILHRPDAVCSVWAVLGRLLWLSSAPSFLRLAEKSGRRAPS